MGRTTKITIDITVMIIYKGQVKTSIIARVGYLNGKPITLKGNSNKAASLFDGYVHFCAQLDAMLPGQVTHSPMFSFAVVGSSLTTVVLPIALLEAQQIYLGSIKGPIVICLGYFGDNEPLSLETLLKIGITRVLPLIHQDVDDFTAYEQVIDNAVAVATAVLPNPVAVATTVIPVSNASGSLKDVLPVVLSDHDVVNYILANSVRLGFGPEPGSLSEKLAKMFRSIETRSPIGSNEGVAPSDPAIASATMPADLHPLPLNDQSVFNFCAAEITNLPNPIPGSLNEFLQQQFEQQQLYRPAVKISKTVDDQELCDILAGIDTKEGGDDADYDTFKLFDGTIVALLDRTPDPDLIVEVPTSITGKRGISPSAQLGNPPGTKPTPEH